MASRRLFQARGAATAKARSPSVDLRVAVTIRSDDVTDHSMSMSCHILCFVPWFNDDCCGEAWISTRHSNLIQLQSTWKLWN